MILKALYDYYQRSKDNLPSFGKEEKEIGFLIVIDKKGRFLRFEDRRIDKKRSSTFLVKKHVGRSSAIIPNTLYDSIDYVLGYSEKSPEKAIQKFEAFRSKVGMIYAAMPDNADIQSVKAFYDMDHAELLEAVRKDRLWTEICKNLDKKYSVFSFLLDGDTRIVAEKDEILDKLVTESADGNDICLITGERCMPVPVTTATMIPGSQAVAKLVAFQTGSGYDSYGKEKATNSPISAEAEFAYTAALKHLLGHDSMNKFSIGDRTYVFWASKDDEAGRQAEEGFYAMLGIGRDKGEENPDKGVEQVRKTLMGIYTGSIRTDLDDRFYILGLAPNSARIAVVYWSETSLKEMAGAILRHYDDMEIIDGRKEKKPYKGLHSILAAVTLGGRSSDATPNLPDVLAKSIFQGLPYPYTLFASCIRRIRAEQTIGIVRVAIIKAFLSRIDNQNKIGIMLDKENTNQGYLCGRLFAVLDKIQADANNQHTIRERYMNAASSTPAAVFATIINLSSHHAEKLNEGRKVYFDKLKQEIMDKISADGFPVHLSLQDQGRFFAGFYHQQQAFYVKNDNNVIE